MMMTRFVFTLLVGLSVVAPSGDALAVWWFFEDKKTVPDFKNSHGLADQMRKSVICQAKGEVG